MITDLQNMAVHTERKRGRPPNSEYPSQVSVRLPSDVHDKLAKESLSTGKPIGELIRQALSSRELLYPKK